MTPAKIKVLVVDDSSVAREVLVRLLESDPGIKVVGAVRDGQAAVEFVAETRPDAVLMDLHMPRLDGLEATRRIMETQPIPIIICSGTTSAGELAATFGLLDAGAIACVEKPVSRAHPRFEPLAADLLRTVKLMSEVKVVRRWPRSRAGAPPGAEWSGGRGRIRCVGIGASTGGPPVLQQILAGLPGDFPAPVLVVQHIARGFLTGLVDWLNQTARVPAEIAAQGVRPLPGRAYFAPDDFHMGLAAGHRIRLVRGEPEDGLRPAVSHLFRSLAEACGPEAAGVLLTGMGRDGAAELKQMMDRGAFTIAQDRETSVVHGMAGTAVELGGASCVLPAHRIAEVLTGIAHGAAQP